MKVSQLLRRILASTAVFLAVSGYASVVERPLSPVSLGNTLTDAHKLATRHGGMQVLQISGDSMLPFFGNGSVVIVKSIEASQLREGMVVVYKNRFGETVAHRLIASGKDGWTAQGYNNTEADSTLVDDSNLVGVVYTTFHSNGQLGGEGTFASLAQKTAIALAAPAK